MAPVTFIAVTGQGVLRATRAPDDSWAVSPVLAGKDVRCLAADPLNRQIVYAGTQGAGMWSSEDSGATWHPAGLDAQNLRSVLPSPLQPGWVFAGAKPPALYVSADYGATWLELKAFRRLPGRRWWRSPAEMPLTAYVQGIALSPTDPQVMVAGIEAGAVVRSADGGKTWSNHRPAALRDCHSLTFHASDGCYVYEGGGTGAGAAFSRDGGETWVQIRDGLAGHYGWACAADPADPEVWYVSTSKGVGMSGPAAHHDGKANAHIYRSEKGGPWQALGGGLPEPLDYMPYALLTDPTAPGHLYAGLANGQVWHSADHGDHWAQLPLDLRGIHRSLIML